MPINIGTEPAIDNVEKGLNALDQYEKAKWSKG